MKAQVFVSHGSHMNGVIIAAHSPKPRAYILSGELRRLMMGSRAAYAQLLDSIRRAS